MGQHTSKNNNNALFTDYEYTRLAETFDINKQDISTVSADTFRTVWSQYMVPALMETWIQYFIRNEFHYQFRTKLDLERFAHLYKDQTSPFIDIKAQGIIKVILGTDLADRILGVNHARVVDYFRDVVISFIRCLEYHQNFQFIKWMEYGSTVHEHYQKQMIYYFVSDLGSTQGKVSELDLERWLRNKTFMDDVLGDLLDMCYSFHEFDEEFHPILPTPTSGTNTVLDLSHVLFLAAHLTSNLKKKWIMVYSSNTHGHNFTKFAASVKEVGPTLFIVRENKGNLFGCFASESWKAAPNFYGDSRCFLFQLAPNIIMFEATGSNNNFMYHNSNQHTLPNGFGLGGQLGFWGLWLDSDFGHGRCQNFCSTFKNYFCVTKSKDFQFDHLEAWAVDSTKVDPNKVMQGEFGSVLEKDPSAKAMMHMAAKIKPDELT